MNVKKPLIVGGLFAVLLGPAVWFRLTTFVDVGYRGFPKVCPLHQVSTKSEFVKNRGFITVSYDGDINTPNREIFPLDGLDHGYGHPDKRYRRILTKYCPGCRKAREQWMAARTP